MRLKLIRKVFTGNSTIGELYISESPDRFCYTLEDPVRDEKIYGETAIPYGSYEIIINMSKRFQRLMPLLLDVPGFGGIRIHVGNTARDTEGCILLGRSKGIDFVGGSRKAYEAFMPILEDALEKDRVFIEITKEETFGSDKYGIA